MLKTVVFPPMSSLCSSFVGYWLFWVMEFRKSFQSSPAPWRLLPVGLRGSFEGHRVEAGKCQKPRRGGGCFCLECLFVCTRSAKEGCNMPRDALERMFRKEWTICCTFLLHQLHAADSGWDVIVGYIHQISLQGNLCPFLWDEIQQQGCTFPWAAPSSEDNPRLITRWEKSGVYPLSQPDQQISSLTHYPIHVVLYNTLCTKLHRSLCSLSKIPPLWKFLH